MSGWTILTDIVMLLALCVAVLGGAAARGQKKPNGAAFLLLAVSLLLVLVAEFCSPSFHMALTLSDLGLGFPVGSFIGVIIIDMVVLSGGVFVFSWLVLGSALAARLQVKAGEWAGNMASSTTNRPKPPESTGGAPTA